MICDQYCPVTAVKFMDEMLYPFIYNDCPDITKFYHILVNHIRFSEAEKFPGLTPPLQFRKSKKSEEK